MFHDWNISEVSMIFRHHRLNCFLNAGHLPPPLSQSLTGWGTEGLANMVILRSLQATASKIALPAKNSNFYFQRLFLYPEHVDACRACDAANSEASLLQLLDAGKWFGEADD